MHFPRFDLSFGATAISLFCLGSTGLAATGGAPGSIHNLGTLGGTHSSGRAINSLNQVAGASERGDGEAHATRFDGIPGADGVLRDLGTLGGANGVAHGVNSSGQVAGWSDTVGETTPRAFRYDGTPGSGGIMHNLGTLGGDTSWGYAINASGQVAGASLTVARDGGSIRAFRFDGVPGNGGVMLNLGTLGGARSEGFGINDAGQVSGRSDTSSGAEHAFRYDGTPGAGGIMRDLGTLGGTDSFGYGMNNSGQVVGDSFIAGDLRKHAFRYDGTPGQGGIMRDLGTPEGAASFAEGINDAAFVVGKVSWGGEQHASLWMPDLTMVDLDVWLNSVNPTDGAKWTLEFARAINNDGWIVGHGTYNDGPGGLDDGTRAFLLDATALVPEPGPLLLTSLAGLLLLCRVHR